VNNFLTAHILVREICRLRNIATGGSSGYQLGELRLSKSANGVVELDLVGVCLADIPVDSLRLSLDDFSPMYLEPMVALYPDVIAHNRRKRKLKTMRAKMKCYGPIRLLA
jgi:hypothetical protein